ncbi:putative coiled-coil domain-containing protein [Apostichopus japonicus]|uniref:Putative coiled-coil domain-containing protein n=1 Tax=Stichopus japonicus TaxID=307972 RepID=A0A2G8KNG6_STIJA|nr:putative coiled-coil domain-containing protein [Apostichopus japonicus]
MISLMGVSMGAKIKFSKKRTMETLYSRGPTLCNTTIKVLRLYGKYMQMISVLKPIAFDVVLCMSELFDYYLFSIYSFFASDVSDGSALGVNSKLWTTLKRISDNITQQAKANQEMNPNTMLAPGSTGFPCVSPSVLLSGIDHLHGLAERIVGTESLVFLATTTEELLQPTLEAVIPSAKKPFLQQFLLSGVWPPGHQPGEDPADDDDRWWDIKDIMSQHSMYVDHMLQESAHSSGCLHDYLGARNQTSQQSHGRRHICIKLSVYRFATAKNCSNEGRALMQLDFQQFLLKLESITQLRPIPDKDFVEAYMKAFYLNEVDLENWVKEHKEYSARQLMGLVNCAVGNRRTRHRILNVIEEFEKGRPR